ncbi:MAG TPA: redoxin domain-containing protein, partial [Tepidisphaeraceae bacterium]|nr:redoxin domain-containing protein [Tepidisphaeraceae bacterium]
MADVLEVGDAVFEFLMPSVSGKEVRLSDKVGVPVVLLFLGDDPAAAEQACRSIAAISVELNSFGGYALAIRMDREGAAAQSKNGDGLPFEILRDMNGLVTE